MDFKYKYFIFDIDGTLIDTERTGVLSLIDTARELLGKEMTYDEGYGYYGYPSSKVGEMLGYRGPEDFRKTWEKNFIRLSYMIKPFEGIGNVLSAIKQAGRSIGCVTSRNRYEFNKDPHLSTVLHYFDYSVCTDDIQRHKPFPDPVLKYMSLAGASPSDCIYIGDTGQDSKCAHGCGCDFALADWSGRGTRDIEAEYHFEKVEEILSLLDM